MTPEPEDREAAHHSIGKNDPDTPERLLDFLHDVIRWAVKAMAVLMTIVIVYGVIDVTGMVLRQIFEGPFLLMEIDDLMELFGAFLAVLIAIEVFTNITVYLRKDIVQVRIVMATALMAIARKVIILDTKDTPSEVVLAIAAVVLAMSIGYWLVVVRGKRADRASKP
jgi:uncharacterized membrane protein (DUF373 family)